ncbi:MAG: DUF4956 domain-containing protein [Bacteroidales bacterium]|nr:DUF4956 domain-containing protein [Bacteroidales bacterium]
MKLLQNAFDPEIAAQFGNQAADANLSDPLNAAYLPENWSVLVNFLVLFVFNLLVCWIITHFLYSKKGGARKDYYFTYMLFSATIFLILYSLNSLKMEMTLALGLFAIFSMIRYRTETVPIREMTYLFVLIGISIINGSGIATDYITLLVTNVLVILLIWLLEKAGLTNRKASKIITYEKIDLIKPERYDELVADLHARTGLEILEVQVGSINFLKDMAFLKVTYVPTSDTPNDIDMITKFKSK